MQPSQMILCISACKLSKGRKQDSTKYDLGKVNYCLETCPCLPNPAAWRAKLRVIGNSGFNWQMCDVICGYGKCFLPFHLLGTVLGIRLVFQSSTIFLSFSFQLSVAKVARSGAEKIGSSQHSWQEHFGFTWLWLFWTSFLHWHVTCHNYSNIFLQK